MGFCKHALFSTSDRYYVMYEWEVKKNNGENSLFFFFLAENQHKLWAL